MRKMETEVPGKEPLIGFPTGKVETDQVFVHSSGGSSIRNETDRARKQNRGAWQSLLNLCDELSFCYLCSGRPGFVASFGVLPDPARGNVERVLKTGSGSNFGPLGSRLGAPWEPARE